MGHPILNFEAVSFSFGSHEVLRNLSFAVDAGETMVVLGPSGSGKSVILKLAVGLLRPDRGRITFNGEEIGDLGENRLRGIRRKMSMVFQSGALFDSMSVDENVAFALREHTDIGDAAVGRRVAECLEMVNLGDTSHLMPEALSGGMKKRVALARAMALEPEVILYDEPTTGLDPVVAGRINRLIRDLQQRLGITSVVVTHDIDSAAYVGDRIAWLHRGAVEYVGTIDEARTLPPGPLQDFLQAREA